MDFKDYDIANMSLEEIKALYEDVMPFSDNDILAAVDKDACSFYDGVSPPPGQDAWYCVYHYCK